MRLFIAVLISILLVSIFVPIYKAESEGLSYLGICNKTWDCNGTYKQWQGEPFGWLETTFGTKCECLTRFLNDSRPKIIRAHLINSPCMRNKRCGRYEALWGYSIASANRAINNPKSRLLTRYQQAVDNLKRRIAGVSDLTCYVSPCLECDLNESSRRILADIVSNALPNCNLVDNPFRRPCLAGTICEQHGESPNLSTPCIIDLDGTNGADIDRNKWLAKYRHCDLQFYWEPWMNCNFGKFVDPRSRICKKQR